MGVTRFCSYPPQAAKIPKMGGYLDPNYEAVLRSKPDLVIVLQEHRTLISFLQKYSIQHLVVGNSSVEEILQSFIRIALACGVKERGDSLAWLLREQLRQDPPNDSAPTVLLCVGRDNPGGGTVSKVFAAGSGSFYDQLLNSSGAKNILTGNSQSYPSLTLENILRLSPDIIIDISAAYSDISSEKLLKDWHSLSSLPAVRQNQIFCLTGDYLTVPGPRLMKVVEQFRKIVKSCRSER